MNYNVCQICGAKDGKAGFLIGNNEKGLVPACANCHDTRTSGDAVIHTHLQRTPEEIEKTLAILNNNPPINSLEYRQSLYEKAIAKWGVKDQMEMAQEEATELALAIRKAELKNKCSKFKQKLIWNTKFK